MVRKSIYQYHSVEEAIRRAISPDQATEPPVTEEESTPVPEVDDVVTAIAPDEVLLLLDVADVDQPPTPSQHHENVVEESTKDHELDTNVHVSAVIVTEEVTVPDPEEHPFPPPLEEDVLEEPLLPFETTTIIAAAAAAVVDTVVESLPPDVTDLPMAVPPSVDEVMPAEDSTKDEIQEPTEESEDKVVPMTDPGGEGGIPRRH